MPQTHSQLPDSVRAWCNGGRQCQDTNLEVLALTRNVTRAEEILPAGILNIQHFRMFQQRTLVVTGATLVVTGAMLVVTGAMLVVTGALLLAS